MNYPIFIVLFITSAGFFNFVYPQNRKIQSEPVLFTQDGSVRIERHDFAVLSKANLSNGKYFFLVFSQPLSRPALANLNSIGIKVTSVYDATEAGHVIYTARIDALGWNNMESLKAVPSFHNLVPIEKSHKHGKKDFFRDKKPIGGKIFIRVACHDDVGAGLCDSVIHGSGAMSVPELGHHVYFANMGIIEGLAAIEEVFSISEADTSSNLLSDRSRWISGVDSLQAPEFNYLGFPPNKDWLYMKRYTGEGISVGIYDTGIDSMHFDFNERDCPAQSCQQRFLRRALYAYPDTNEAVEWKYSDGSGSNHGVKVAGIAAGNGWRSLDAGGDTLQWRGVAPKSQIISWPTDNEIQYADVNNHSHITNEQANYGPADRTVDNSIWPHHRGHSSTNPSGLLFPTNIWVYSAGNNGIYPTWGTPLGYYSIQSGSKNSIAVGSINSGDTVRSYFSSMGPTYDGRVKPDIMAAGCTNKYLPLFNNQYPLTVELDYARLKIGDTVFTWGFDGGQGEQGWSVSFFCRNLHQERGSVLAFNLARRVHDAGVKVFLDRKRAISADDSVAFEFRMLDTNALFGPFDHARFPVIALDVWGIFDTGKSFRTLDCNRVLASHIGNGLYRFEGKLRSFVNGSNKSGWVPGDSINMFRLDFAGDPVHFGIRGPIGTMAASAGDGYYEAGYGTSQSAPVVTGIIALMLQKYKDDFLRADQNIHDHAFWNSTAKAILIHSATDLIHDDPDPREMENPDFMSAPFNDTTRSSVPSASWDLIESQPVFYHKGPDYATGYGLVNAVKALDFVDTARFEEDSVEHGQAVRYAFDVPAGVSKLRFTLAWDDLPGNPNAPQRLSKLINHLDLRLTDPAGIRHQGGIYGTNFQKIPENSRHYFLKKCYFKNRVC